MKHQHVEWCRKMFAALKDGGVWGIPRTGLIFRKRGNALVLQHSIGQSAEGIRQASEYATTKKYFGAAGVVVSEEYVPPDEYQRMSDRLVVAKASGGFS